MAGRDVDAEGQEAARRGSGALGEEPYVEPALTELALERPWATALFVAGAVAGLAWAASLFAVFVLRGPMEVDQDAPLQASADARAGQLEAGKPPGDALVPAHGEALVWFGSADGVAELVAGEITPAENPLPADTTGLSAVRFDGRRDLGDGRFEDEPINLRVATAELGDGRLVLVGADIEEIDGRLLDVSRVLFLCCVLLFAATFWLVRRRVEALAAEG